uniref:RxLR effector candidate protein n=1 Tax=Peronospora matthiolae TaxID=2874970 RepID=A0AAV1TEH0_9STRA
MYRHFALPLLAAALCATTGASLQRSQPGSLNLVEGYSPTQNVRLRSHADDEERGVVDAVAETEAAVSAISSKMRGKLSMANERTKEYLAMLHLDNPPVDYVFMHKPWVTQLQSVSDDAARVAVVKALTDHYGEEAMVSAIIAAKNIKNEKVKKVAGIVQTALVQMWVAHRKSALDVFQGLKLNEAVEWGQVEASLAVKAAKFFNNPKFAIWTTFVYNLKEGDALKADIEIVKTLTIFYTDGPLAMMLFAAKDAQETEEVATKLIEAQLYNWLVDENQTWKVYAWMGIRQKLLNPKKKALHRKYRELYNDVYVKGTLTLPMDE